MRRRETPVRSLPAHCMLHGATVTRRTQVCGTNHLQTCRIPEIGRRPKIANSCKQRQSIGAWESTTNGEFPYRRQRMMILCGVSYWSGSSSTVSHWSGTCANKGLLVAIVSCRANYLASPNGSAAGTAMVWLAGAHSSEQHIKWGDGQPLCHLQE